MSALPAAGADRRVSVRSGGIAALVALLLLVVVPRGGDAAAHLYRTLLVEHGALVWDNLWFAGQYPLASYSVLYYLPAAVVGNALLAAAGVVASALLFAAIVVRAWGRVARWGAYSFAVLAGGQFFTGDYPYTLGFTFLLASVFALQRGRRALGVACAGITLGCSPLAFLFLCLTLAALLVRSRRPRLREVALALPLGVIAVLELAVLHLFPSPRLTYPFTLWRLMLGVPVGVVGALVASRGRSRALVSVFAVWTAATIVAYTISSPFGHNLLRPATVVFPIMLIAASLARFRPCWLAVPAVVGAFAANVGPYVATVVSRDDPAAAVGFWRPMLTYVRRHSSAAFRLEVVPTVNHWEAYYVPRAGFAIARGWYQQLDSGANAALYRRPLTPRAYRAWLRSVGVEDVVVANTAPAAEAGPELRLLRSGRSGLARVFSSREGSVYELPHATPIVTGSARAAIVAQSFSGIRGWASRPGRYLMRVHFTPYWKLRRGALCVSRAPDDMTYLHVERRGSFTLHAAEGPVSVAALLLDADGEAVCR